MAELNILEAIRGAMDEEMQRDDRVMVLGEDVGRKGGVFGATEGLWAKYGDRRVLDTARPAAWASGSRSPRATASPARSRPVAESKVSGNPSRSRSPSITASSARPASYRSLASGAELSPQEDCGTLNCGT